MLAIHTVQRTCLYLSFLRMATVSRSAIYQKRARVRGVLTGFGTMGLRRGVGAGAVLREMMASARAGGRLSWQVGTMEGTDVEFSKPQMVLENSSFWSQKARFDRIQWR